MKSTIFEPCSGTVGKAPTRNRNFFYGTYLLSDLDDLFEAGVPRGPRILVGAILLNFLRNQFVTNKRRKWHAPQKWYLHNQFSEKIFSRQFIGESLDWLVKVGVISKEQEPGYTNQICYGFIGFSSRESAKGEDLLTSRRKLNNEIESPFQNSIFVGAPNPHLDATEPHLDATEPHPSYIYKNNTSPSHKPGGGEKCVTFKKRKDDEEDIYQDSEIIDNGNKSQHSKSIENENEIFPRKHKDVRLKKNSEEQLPPAQVETVNMLAPGGEGLSGRQARIIKKDGDSQYSKKQQRGLMLSKDELTLEHLRRFEDFEFMSYVARKWSHTGQGEGTSYIGSLKTIWEKIAVVEGSFLKEPPKIDVQWKAYIRGTVTKSLEDLVESLEKGMNRQYLDKKHVERYLPSIAIEMQSENPVATEPMLQFMGQLLEQYQLAEQQQHSLASAMEMELDEVTRPSAISESVNVAIDDIFDAQVISEPEVAELNEDMHYPEIFPADAAVPAEDAEGAPPIAILRDIYKKGIGRSLVTSQITSNPQWGYAIVNGDIVIKDEQRPEPDWDAIAQEVEQVEQMRLEQELLGKSDDGDSSWTISGAIAQQSEQKSAPVTTEALGDFEERSLTDSAISGGKLETQVKDEITSEGIGIASLGKLGEVIKIKVEERSRLVQMEQELHSQRRAEEHKRLLELDRELQSRYMAQQNQVVTKKAPGDEFDF